MRSSRPSLLTPPGDRRVENSWQSGANSADRLMSALLHSGTAGEIALAPLVCELLIGPRQVLNPYFPAWALKGAACVDSPRPGNCHPAPHGFGPTHRQNNTL